MILHSALAVSRREAGHLVQLTFHCAIHVRFDAVALTPFWRVLVSPGHDNSFFTNLRRDKIVRLDPETAREMRRVPDEVAIAKQAIEIVQQPCHGHLAALTWRLKKIGFETFNQ